MSKLISEEIVEAITLGDKEGFMSAFHSALAAKVSDALEIKKVEIASTLIAPASSEVVEEEVEEIDEAGIHDFIGGVLSGKSDREVAQDAARSLYNKMQLAQKTLPGYKHPDPKNQVGKKLGVKEEVEQIDEAAKEPKVTFGRGHSGQPGGEGQADVVTTHHDNGLKVKSSIGWDGDHSIDVHHNGKHVGSIFSTHGGGGFEKNEKYKGEIGHKEVKAAMSAHQKHPEVQSWLIHNHPESESEAHDYGKINGHKLHPTAKKYLEKVSNDDDRDYEAPYKPQTKSAAAAKPKSKASTSGAYEKALAALKKKHGITEEVEQIDELSKDTLRKYVKSAEADATNKNREATKNRLVGKRSPRHADAQATADALDRARNKRLDKIDLARAKMANEEVEEIDEAKKSETRISWRSRTPEEIEKSDKRLMKKGKLKITSAELEARARARRGEKSE